MHGIRYRCKLGNAKFLLLTNRLSPLFFLFEHHCEGSGVWSFGQGSRREGGRGRALELLQWQTINLGSSGSTLRSFSSAPFLPSHLIRSVRPSRRRWAMSVGLSVGGVGYSSLRDGWMDRWMLGCSVGWVRLMWRFCGTRCIAAERDRRCRRRRRRQQRNAIARERMREGVRQGQVAEFNAGTAPRERGANACGVRECSARGVTDDSIKVSGCNDRRPAIMEDGCYRVDRGLAKISSRTG